MKKKTLAALMLSSLISLHSARADETDGVDLPRSFRMFQSEISAADCTRTLLSALLKSKGVKTLSLSVRVQNVDFWNLHRYYAVTGTYQLPESTEVAKFRGSVEISQDKIWGGPHVCAIMSGDNSTTFPLIIEGYKRATLLKIERVSGLTYYGDTDL